METLYDETKFNVEILNEGKIVNIHRLLDGVIKTFSRATNWPQAESFMRNITTEQMGDYFPKQRKVKK